jgi:phosphoribosylanthranilate isomerase
LKIKICGITNIGDALLSESLGADALGFIFYKGSKRFIEPEAAGEIISELSPFTLKIGVFVNSSSEEINKTAKEIKLNAVQLHGDETPGMVSEVNFPVIKSFRINNGFDFLILKDFHNVSYLFDTYSENEYGGTGRTFNWELIPVELRSKIVLSGGISVNNIEEIYKKIKPAGVDLSSSLESEPGRKDNEKVKEFFKKINYLRSLQNGNHDETKCT